MYNIFLRNLVVFCTSVLFLFAQDVTLTLDGGDLNYVSSSDIYGWITFNSIGDANSGLGVKVFRNTSATVTTSHTAISGGTENPSDSTGTYSFYTVSGSDSAMCTWLFKDTITGMDVGQAMYYGFFAREYAADDTVRIGGAGGVSQGFISMMVMEIAK